MTKAQFAQYSLATGTINEWQLLADSIDGDTYVTLWAKVIPNDTAAGHENQYSIWYFDWNGDGVVDNAYLVNVRSAGVTCD